MKKEFEILYQEIETIKGKRLKVEALYSTEISLIVIELELGEDKKIIQGKSFKRSDIIRQAIKQFDSLAEKLSNCTVEPTETVFQKAA